MAANAAEKAAGNPANPCIAIGEVLEPCAVAGVVIEDMSAEEEMIGIRAGLTGYITFAISERDAPRYEDIDFDAEPCNTEPPIRRGQRWKDPAIREIENICAQHKAELMHLSLGNDPSFERVKCCELNGYALQTMVWLASGNKRRCDL